MNVNYVKAILDHSPECIVLIGKNHEILAFNKVIQEVLRKYHGKDIGIGDKYYPDFVVEDLRELYISTFNKAVTGETHVIQTLTENENTSIWFEYTMRPVYDEKNELLGVTLSAKDIDAAKRSEIKIQSLSEKLKAILDSSDDAITLLDNDYQILAMNQMAINTFKKNSYPIALGDNFKNVLPDRSHNFFSYFQAALTGKSSEVEMCYTNANGGLLWFMTKFAPVYRENGEMIGVSVFSKDITERKQLKSTLKEIAWKQSHLVRAPLARMMGIINLMSEMKTGCAQSETYQKHLIESARELDQIINDIEIKTQL